MPATSDLSSHVSSPSLTVCSLCVVPPRCDEVCEGKPFLVTLQIKWEHVKGRLSPRRRVLSKSAATDKNVEMAPPRPGSGLGGEKVAIPRLGCSIKGTARQSYDHDANDMHGVIEGRSSPTPRKPHAHRQRRISAVRGVPTTLDSFRNRAMHAISPPPHQLLRVMATAPAVPMMSCVTEKRCVAHRAHPWINVLRRCRGT